MKSFVQSLARHGTWRHLTLESMLNFRVGSWNGSAFRRQANQVLDNPWVFFCCKLIIGFVSAYDIFLTIKYVEYLPYMELNPLGRFLMQLDSGPNCELSQIACFVAAKFAGNFLTLAILEGVRTWHARFATSIGVVIATLQLFLLWFLTTH